MDRLIAEHEPECRIARCHLLSVIGNDQEIAAIGAAISEDACFYASAPQFKSFALTLGKDANVYRGSISMSGRRRPLRHLVVLSEEFSQTRAGGNPTARRTVLCIDDPAFMLFRIGARFGLPVLPEWSDWFGRELERHDSVEPLVGLGCRPVLVNGTKKRFLGWIGHALKRGVIQIPRHDAATSWRPPNWFEADVEECEAEFAELREHR